jgi:hypothetical protein
MGRLFFKGIEPDSQRHISPASESEASPKLGEFLIVFLPAIYWYF